QPPAAQPARSTMKMAKPDKFDGKKEKSNDFRVACMMYLQVNHCQDTDENKIWFIISYLEGAARKWLKPHMDAELIGNQQVPWLHDLGQFWGQFEQHFGEINKEETYCK